jgi:hypothetical protein
MGRPTGSPLDMETPEEQPGYAERDSEPVSQPTGGGVEADESRPEPDPNEDDEQDVES